jgi:hypothetical protein
LVIADQLTSHDLNVRSPGCEGSQQLTVTNVPGMTCHVSVAADGLVEWAHAGNAEHVLRKHGKY